MNYPRMDTRRHSLIESNINIYPHTQTIEHCIDMIEPIPLFSPSFNAEPNWRSTTPVEAVKVSRTTNGSLPRLVDCQTHALAKTLEMAQTNSQHCRRGGSPTTSNSRRDTNTLRKKSDERPMVFPKTYQLGPLDVICGRHKAAVNHTGNRRFRTVISNCLPKYFEYPSRIDRAILTLEIIESLDQSGGYFLKERRDMDSWEELTEKEKKNKVGHALRDAAASTSSFGRAAPQKKKKCDTPTRKKPAKHESESSLENSEDSSVNHIDASSVPMPEPIDLVNSRQCNGLHGHKVETLDAILGEDNPLDFHAFTHKYLSRLGSDQLVESTPSDAPNPRLGNHLLADLVDFEF